MTKLISEQDAMKMAVDSNYLYYGGYETIIERRPTDGCASRFMYQSENLDIVIPSDFFIVLAVFNCGVASAYAVATMLHKMRDDDPEKAIIRASYSDEMANHNVAYRLSKLERTGIFLKRRLVDKNSERAVLTYTVAPDAVRFVLRMVENTNYVRSDMLNYWPERREVTRQFMISNFIMRSFELTTIRHFSKYKSIPKRNGGIHEFRYLWLSILKNNVKRSVIVYPFVFTNDALINNERENELNSIIIPFQKLNAFLDYTKNSEYEGGLVLIVDKEDDLGKLAQHVMEKIPVEYHNKIMLTTLGLMRTQPLHTMFFNVHGKFVQDSDMLF